MAPRAFWKGYLRLSLVTCPVAMTPAISEREKVRFHTLNRATGNRVESRYVDATSGEDVDDDAQVKGYESGADQYVMLEDEELDAIALENARTIDIETFAPKDSLDWIWYDRPHYLAPDDPVGVEAFSVIREAMKATGTVAISRLVLYRREHAVMLEPRDRGIVLWTLRYGDEVRDQKEYFADIRSEKADPELTSLMTTLIKERSKPWTPAMARDEVQEHLVDIIESKRQGKRPPKRKEAAAPPNNVVSIMDALRKSIESESKKPPKRR